MKHTISEAERDILDQALQIADQPRQICDRIVYLLEAALVVDQWDLHAKETINRAVREARVSLEDVLHDLGVEVRRHER